MNFTQQQILDAITAHEEDVAEGVALMDEDDLILSGAEYFTPDQSERLEDHVRYTSNNPATFYDLMLSMLGGASVRYIVPTASDEPDDQEVANQAKERFVYGLMAAAEERLSNITESPLQMILADQILRRSVTLCRFTLVKDEEGRTSVDITPFDARYAFWVKGPRGLKLAGQKIEKRIQDVEAEYGITVPKKLRTGKTLWVIDAYDEESNVVFTSDKLILKPPTPHGANRVPVAVAYSGIARLANGVRWGKSLFGRNREAYKAENFLLSAKMSVVGFAVNQAFVTESKGAKRRLGKNPRKGKGGEIPLDIGEKVYTLVADQLGPGTDTINAQISANVQKGSVADIMFGSAPFTMPGVAIDKLRQPLSAVILPYQTALQNIYQQGSRLLCDQYTSERFNVMSVAGYDRQRRWFRADTMPPAVIRQGGNVAVKVTPSLPKDDASRLALALQSSTPGPDGRALVTRKWALENYLEVEDAGLEDAAALVEAGENANPVIKARKMMLAAARAGNLQDADTWYMMGMMAMQQMTMAMMQVGLNPGQMSNRASQLVGPNGQALNTGFSPTVLPGAAVANPPAYNPVQGPQVMPGTPRPSAQQAPGVASALNVPPGMLQGQ